MPFSRFRLFVCAAWACLAGCQTPDTDTGSLSPRGGGSETTVVGRVLDDSGRAVEGAAVWMRDEDESPLDQLGSGSGSAGEALAYSDADGKYRIDRVHTGLRYLIECRRSAGKAAVVIADADDRDTVHAPDAVLRPTGTIRGRILSPDTLYTSPAIYVYIPGLWQRAIKEAGSTAFEIRDVPAGTYVLRFQPAYPAVLANLAMLDLPGVKVEPGETTDVGESTLPLRSAMTASAAYAHDSEVVAGFGMERGGPARVAEFSAVLGKRIVSVYDLVGLGGFAEIPDRIRELDALESIYLLRFRDPMDSLDEGRIKSISPAISELPRLRSLRLPHISAERLPRWTGTFPALTSLNLADARLTSIPDWILERKRLANLELSMDSLETLPEAFARLRDLRVLDLSGNRFRTLPPILMQMKSLAGVNLRRNRICSASPAERAWIARQDSIWYRDRDPLDSYPDSLSWEATQDCGTP